MIRFLLLSFLFLFGLACSAQSSLRHMHYNLTLYGNPYGCDESNNNSNQKDAALAQIMTHAQADVLTVNELHDENYWANRLLGVLQDGEGDWDRAQLTFQYTWSSILNSFFYRSDRYHLHEQEVVYEGLDEEDLLRPIDLYTIYPHENGEVQGDTLFITFIVAHLSAGDMEERSRQTEALMAHLEERGPENYVFTGDLNMDSAWEEAFQNLIDPQNPNLAFIDPISTSNNWHNNPSVAEYHTQSTRSWDTNGGCFSGGGLDDRFDISLLSPSLYTGTSGFTYLDYGVLGQTGDDYNQSLQIAGNTAIPQNIAQALYDMSDHLPVIVNLQIDDAVGLADSELPAPFQLYARGERLGLERLLPGDYQIRLYDLSGKLLFQEEGRGRGLTELRSVDSGLYLLQLKHEEHLFVEKVAF